jgi:hypothetical protein
MPTGSGVLQPAPFGGTGGEKGEIGEIPSDSRWTFRNDANTMLTEIIQGGKNIDRDI